MRFQAMNMGYFPIKEPFEVNVFLNGILLNPTQTVSSLDSKQCEVFSIDITSYSGDMVEIEVDIGNKIDEIYEYNNVLNMKITR